MRPLIGILLLLPFLPFIYAMILWIPTMGTGLIPERTLLSPMLGILLLPFSMAALGFQVLVSRRHSCRQRWLWLLLLLFIPFITIPILVYDFHFKSKHE